MTMALHYITNLRHDVEKVGITFLGFWKSDGCERARARTHSTHTTNPTGRQRRWPLFFLFLFSRLSSIPFATFCAQLWLRTVRHHCHLCVWTFNNSNSYFVRSARFVCVCVCVDLPVYFPFIIVVKWFRGGALGIYVLYLPSFACSRDLVFWKWKTSLVLSLEQPNERQQQQ